MGSPSLIWGVVQVLACCVSYLHCLVPQGMESPPREEVFLGAFQFQPENTIQMFPLQVPGEATKAPLLRVPHVQLSPVPYSPEKSLHSHSSLLDR